VLEEVAKQEAKMTEKDRGTITVLDNEGLSRLESRRKEKDLASRHGKPAVKHAHNRKES
jgi:hypothetical protein